MQLAPSTLPLGRRGVNPVEMAKHVEPIAEFWRTGVQIPPAPPIPKPQPLSVGVFSCLIAPVPACCWGFLRKPADFGVRPLAPSKATFLSRPAVFLSGLAPPYTPEVRKRRKQGHYKSMRYARTNQAVGLQHWVAEETPCQDNVRTPTIEASKINPEGHHEHPESFQDRTH